MTVRKQIAELKERIGNSIIGQRSVIDRLIIGLLANGNLLVEGLPGLAKTRAIKALARNLEADFSRIQFTPDLLPSDVTGTEVYQQAGGKAEFRFEPGPLFANIVLADEINIVHHTDAERAFAYDREGPVGKLVRGLDKGPERGWLTVDMAEDWEQVWPNGD